MLVIDIESMMLCKQRIRRIKLTQLINIGEKIYCITNVEGVKEQMSMYKGIGTLWRYDVTLVAFSSMWR